MQTRGKGSIGERLGSVAVRHRLPARWRPARARRIYRSGAPGQLLDGSVPVGAGPDRDQVMARLEALLLLAREPLSSRKLAQLAGLADGTKARTLVRALNSRYDSEGCAFRAEEVAGGFQLLTRPQFAPWLRRLDSTAVDVRLSAPAMETLAVVAYRQPVLRAEVEAVRGVQCGEILRQLIERDLVRVTGRSDDLGRPLLYGTTRRFLRAFGLRHLDELPRPAVMPKPCNGTISEDNDTNPTSTPKTVSEESEVTTLTRPRHKSTCHNEEQPLQDTEFLSDPLRNDLEEDDDPEEDDDFDEDDFDDDEEDEEDEEEYDDEEDEEDEDEDELDDDLDEEPWEEVDDEEEEEDDDEEDWEDDDDLDDDEDEDDEWDDDDDWDDE